MDGFSLLTKAARIADFKLSSHPQGLEESELAGLGGIFVKGGESISVLGTSRWQKVREGIP